MNKIIVLKDEAYLAKQGGGSVTMKTLAQLKRGALAIVVDGELYNGQAISNKSQVTFVVGIAPTASSTYNVKSVGPITRRDVKKLNFVAGTVGQPMVLGIGTDVDTPTGFETLLTDNTEGTMDITIKNLSYNHNISAGTFSTSVTKKAGQTPSDFAAKVLDALTNVSNGIPKYATKPDFFVAALEANGGDPYITITGANESVDLSIHIQGLLEGEVKIIDEVIYSLGAGTDVLRTEKDYSGNEGNGGYVENTDLWYNQTFEADPAQTYNITNLYYQAKHSFPQNTGNSALIHIEFATIPESVIGDVLVTLLQELFGEAYDAGNGEVVSKGFYLGNLSTFVAAGYTFTSVFLPAVIVYFNSLTGSTLPLNTIQADVVDGIASLNETKLAKLVEEFGANPV
jgi:hypothetical protein